MKLLKLIQCGAFALATLASAQVRAEEDPHISCKTTVLPLALLSANAEFPTNLLAHKHLAYVIFLDPGESSPGKGGIERCKQGLFLSRLMEGFTSCLTPKGMNEEQATLSQQLSLIGGMDLLLRLMLTEEPVHVGRTQRSLNFLKTLKSSGHPCTFEKTKVVDFFETLFKIVYAGVDVENAYRSLALECDEFSFALPLTYRYHYDKILDRISRGMSAGQIKPEELGSVSDADVVFFDLFKAHGEISAGKTTVGRFAEFVNRRFEAMKTKYKLPDMPNFSGN